MSGKQRKKLLDELFHKTFAPPPGEKLWADEYDVPEPEFWRSIGLPPALPPPVEPLTVCTHRAAFECERFRRYGKLRKRLGAMCGMRYPSMCFERWALAANDEARADTPLDPLLPTPNAAGGSTLTADLLTAGYTAEAAESLVTAFQREALGEVRAVSAACERMERECREMMAAAAGGAGASRGAGGGADARYVLEKTVQGDKVVLRVSPRHQQQGGKGYRPPQQQQPSKNTEGKDDVASLPMKVYEKLVELFMRRHRRRRSSTSTGGVGSGGGCGGGCGGDGNGDGGVDGGADGKSETKQEKKERKQRHRQEKAERKKAKHAGAAATAAAGTAAAVVNGVAVTPSPSLSTGSLCLSVADLAGCADAAVFALVKRHDALGGPGYQAALPPGVFDALRARFAAGTECFASPLNCRYDRFCSQFPDTDRPFGSLGPFEGFGPTRGSFEVNPPFAPAPLLRAVERVERLLEASEQDDGDGDDGSSSSKGKGKGKGKSKGKSKPLCFAFCTPTWTDGEAWQRLDKSRWVCTLKRTSNCPSSRPPLRLSLLPRTCFAGAFAFCRVFLAPTHVRTPRAPPPRARRCCVLRDRPVGTASLLQVQARAAHCGQGGPRVARHGRAGAARGRGYRHILPAEQRGQEQVAMHGGGAGGC
jgi:uncharacterized membrane protein YgcG